MSDPYPHPSPEAATEPSPVAEENAQQPRPARLAVTLDAALAMDDTYSGMLEVACLLAEKAAAVPDSLSHPEQVVRTLTTIDCQVCNGGWLQWLYNTESSRLARSVRDLRELGCVLMADLAQQALAAAGIDQRPTEDDQTKDRLLDDLTEGSHATLDVLNSQFFAFAEDFMSIARGYILAHRNSFDL